MVVFYEETFKSIVNYCFKNICISFSFLAVNDYSLFQKTKCEWCSLGNVTLGDGNCSLIPRQCKKCHLHRAMEHQRRMWNKRHPGRRKSFLKCLVAMAMRYVEKQLQITYPAKKKVSSFCVFH